MVHIETRPPKDGAGEVVLDVLMTVEIVKDRIIHLAHRVKNAKYVNMAKLVGCKRATVQVSYPDDGVVRYHTLTSYTKYSFVNQK